MGWVDDVATALKVGAGSGTVQGSATAGSWLGNVLGSDAATQSVPIETIVQMVRGGNSAELHQGAQGAVELSDAHHATSQDMNSMMTSLESSWTGPGAQAALARIQKLAGVVNSASTTFAANAQNVTSTAASFDHAKSAMTDMPPRPDKAFATSPSLFNLDTAQAVSDYNAQASQNLGVYNGYHDQAASSTSSLKGDYGQLGYYDGGDATLAKPSSPPGGPAPGPGPGGPLPHGKEPSPGPGSVAGPPPGSGGQPGQSGNPTGGPGGSNGSNGPSGSGGSNAPTSGDGSTSSSGYVPPPPTPGQPPGMGGLPISSGTGLPGSGSSGDIAGVLSGSLGGASGGLAGGSSSGVGSPGSSGGLGKGVGASPGVPGAGNRSGAGAMGEAESTGNGRAGGRVSGSSTSGGPGGMGAGGRGGKKEEEDAEHARRYGLDDDDPFKTDGTVDPVTGLAVAPPVIGQ